jgi:malate synthase
MLDEVVAGLEGAGVEGGARLGQARSLFERVALADDFVDFLTVPAYEAIGAGRGGG